MKAILALLVAVAMIGSAAAWDISECINYKYTKNMYEQAGDEIILNQLEDAKSGAYFCEPSAFCSEYPWETTEDDDCYTRGFVTNQLVDVIVDRQINNPPTNLENADMYVTLTQGGEACVYTHSINSETSVPEIRGTANAYQNLNLRGGFEMAQASFDSKAVVGMFGEADSPTSNWVVTQLLDENYARVDAETEGAGEFMHTDLGVKVKADMSQDFDGSNWMDAKYSGGIEMWAEFDDACDPNCANPIISTVTGSTVTAILPGDPSFTLDRDGDGNIDGMYGGEDYWGTNLWCPDYQYPASAVDWWDTSDDFSP